MSRFASTSRLRGMRTIRSSGPHPAVAGSLDFAASVMSMPIMAKSPFESSQMSGQLQRATVCLPFLCGSGPILRKNSRFAFITPNIKQTPGGCKIKIPAIAGFMKSRFSYSSALWQNTFHIANRLPRPFASTEKRRR